MLLASLASKANNFRVECGTSFIPVYPQLFFNFWVFFSIFYILITDFGVLIFAFTECLIIPNWFFLSNNWTQLHQRTNMVLLAFPPNNSCYIAGRTTTTDVAVTRHCIKDLEGLHPVSGQGLRARAPPVFCPPPPGFIERTTITRCVPSKTTTWLLGCRVWSADCLFFDWRIERRDRSPFPAGLMNENRWLVLKCSRSFLSATISCLFQVYISLPDILQ